MGDKDAMLAPVEPDLALPGAMEKICQAAIAGDLESVKQAVSKAQQFDGYSIDCQGTCGRTPLYQACLGRQAGVIGWLLEEGATDPTGDAYIAICAPGVLTPSSADPATRAAQTMQSHGYVGSPAGRKQKTKFQKHVRSSKRNGKSDQFDRASAVCKYQ